MDEHAATPATSSSEKVWVEINGVLQGMFITGTSPDNPVLLVVHGGPGMPGYFLNGTHPTALSDLFTVVWWDQRGAGLSYHPDIPPQTMTVEQLIDDVTEVTDHLRVWSGQGRVHLLGHSWGSFLGIQAAARTPQLFHSYIGTAQVTSQLESEMLAYDDMLAEYRRRHDTRMCAPWKRRR